MRLALALLLLLVVASSAEAAKVSCASGTTAFVTGNLRIFGVHFDNPDPFGGFEFGDDEYACVGGAGPRSVGGTYSNSGTGSADTPAYAYDGRRYLAVYDTDDGEGGPSAHLRVLDLVRKRSFAFTNVACCEGVPAFRVGGDGTLVALTPGEGLFVKRPGHRARSLAEEGVPRDLAMRGGTVYWTEGGVARSAVLDGLSGGEATMLEPVRMRRRGGACAAGRSRTVAASGSVRVMANGFGCRIGAEGRFRVRGAARIVADRWVLVRRGDTARVIDSRSGRTVARADAVADATLLADGTLAWIAPDGRLLVWPGDSGASLILGAGADELAAARRVVYWTENGAPRSFRR
jgi:hypothetical protein